jgi:hypothetical protein
MTHFVDKGYRAMLAEIDSLSDEILCCSEAHEAAKALIRELVVALKEADEFLEGEGVELKSVNAAIAKAKIAGY